MLLDGFRTTPQHVQILCLSSPIRIWLTLAISLSILLLLRLIALYIAKTDLFFDEAQYWAWSQQLDFGYFSKPPGLAWIIRAGTESCGLSEFCVRITSPILHSLTAFFLFLAARTLFNNKIALISALAYATLPGISFSSTLISTDVPLLLFWTIALWAFANFIKHQNVVWTIILGLALGFGLLSKYAMLYFIGNALIYALISKHARNAFQTRQFSIAIAIAFILILPNIFWNLQNGLVTFSHTADNANWTGSLLNPTKTLEFFGAQFGVFGPILFAALLIIALQTYRESHDTTSDQEQFEIRTFLLCFSIPIITIILIQAFLSRAHANWAATAYPAATLLVIAVMMQDNRWRWLQMSFAIHGIIAILLIFSGRYAGEFSLPGNNDPYSRVLGWQEIATKTRALSEKHQLNTIITERRALTAELLYYLHKTDLEVYSWKAQSTPKDHFQLTRPFSAQKAPLQMLLVTFKQNPNHILSKFDKVTPLSKHTIPAGLTRTRTLYFFQLSGYKADAT
ncbi:MAG: glycosyltransferase family 39 protein [Pseudomonadota bacterium]